MSSFDEVRRLLKESAGAVFPSAQLVVGEEGVEVLRAHVGDCGEDTRFDVASLTKALCTAQLAMHSVDEGRLGLDEVVHHGPGAGHPITVRHLLGHSAGLPAWQLLQPAPGFDDPRAGIVETVRRTPLQAPPGARSVYSDLGFILLGDLIEQRLGDRLDRLFSARIAHPLGLQTSFGPCPSDRCAPTEGEIRGVVHDENCRAMGGVAGHAGLFSTARDVSRIVAALVAAWRGAPASVVSSSTVRAFWSPCGVAGSTWCLGWDRPSLEGSSAGTLWPRDGVGHLGFTGCSIWIAPALGRWVVLLSNRVHPSRANEAIKAFRPQLHDAVWRALDRG